MIPHSPKDVFSRSLGDVLRTSGASLGCQIRTSLDIISRRPKLARSGRRWDATSGRPRDGQIGSLGDILVTLEGNLLWTSWGPIFTG